LKFQSLYVQTESISQNCRLSVWSGTQLYATPGREQRMTHTDNYEWDECVISKYQYSDQPLQLSITALLRQQGRIH
jgi:hypothetical protein